MDILEIKEKRTLSREEAAQVLRQIADSLARHNELQFTREGKALHVKVPDEVELEVELEIESDETSLEIELNW
mgnify:FL=1